MTYRGGTSPVNVADPLDARVTDIDDTSMTTLTMTADGISGGSQEVFIIAGTEFPQGTDKTADVTAGGTDFTVTYTAATP